MKRVVVLALLASSFVLTSAGSANACTCLPLNDLKSVLRRADGAFVGSFVARSAKDASPSLPYANYEFEVNAVYKGAIPSEIVVRSGRDSAACGIAAREGDSIGLFLEREEGVWTSGSCSQVSAADMRRTGVRPSAPTDGEAARPVAEGANAIPVEALWAAAGALLVLTLALTMARQRAES